MPHDPSNSAMPANTLTQTVGDHDKFPCPCCGHLVHDQVPGFHQICPICGWEDDLTQLRFPQMPGSSNTVSLAEAQRNYCSYGASERRNAGNTRTPVEGERVEASWRPLDPTVDNIEQPTRGASYADSYPWPDTTVLYYWRSTYWRRLAS
ncbi:MAG: CPCC family cysteine-rich protein [Thiohalocapsa sp.]